jgi:hypothetical protein
MTDTYHEEVYIEELFDVVLIAFEYDIEGGQGAITSGDPNSCQPGIPDEVEIVSMESCDPDIMLTEQTIEENADIECIKQNILEHSKELAAESRIDDDYFWD